MWPLAPSAHPHLNEINLVTRNFRWTVGHEMMKRERERVKKKKLINYKKGNIYIIHMYYIYLCSNKCVSKKTSKLSLRPRMHAYISDSLSHINRIKNILYIHTLLYTRRMDFVPSFETL